MMRSFTAKRALIIWALAFVLAVFAILPAVGCGPSGSDVVSIATPGATEPPAENTPASVFTEQPSDEPVFTPEPQGTVPPIISKSGSFQTYDNTNVMRVDDRAYEICYFLDEEPKLYAKLISEAAQALNGVTNVYDLIIPTAYGVMMPDDMRGKISYYIEMGDCIEKTYSYMSPEVNTISCFDTMMLHRDEYIYFRTDHHWTALGAYYAYYEFCMKKGMTPIAPEEHRSVTFDNFLGTLYRDSGNDPELLPADEIVAYYPISESIKMEITSADGSVYPGQVITDVSNYSPVAKYNTFAGSDNPITEYTNPEVTDGSVLIIIKDSFGNALIPFLVDHYSKVYEIDYRYWKGNVIELARTVNATDLIFSNNFMMISSKSNIGKISKIVK